METKLGLTLRMMMKRFHIFKRTILRRIFGPVKERCVWKRQTNKDLYGMDRNLDIYRIGEPLLNFNRNTEIPKINLVEKTRQNEQEIASGQYSEIGSKKRPWDPELNICKLMT